MLTPVIHPLKAQIIGGDLNFGFCSIYKYRWVVLTLEPSSTLHDLRGNVLFYQQKLDKFLGRTINAN